MFANKIKTCYTAGAVANNGRGGAAEASKECAQGQGKTFGQRFDDTCPVTLMTTLDWVMLVFSRSNDLGCAQETKSGRLTTLPPPPDELHGREGRKGKKSGSNDMPRSLQKMLRLKARETRLMLFFQHAIAGVLCIQPERASLWTGAGRAGKQIKEESNCQQREAGSVSTCTWRPAGRRSGSGTSAGLASSEAGASISRRWRQQPAGGEACRGDRATPRRKQQRPEPAGGKASCCGCPAGPSG